MKQSSKFLSLSLFAALGFLTVVAGCSKRGQQQEDLPPSYYDRTQTGASGVERNSERFDGMGQPKKRVTVFPFLNEAPVGTEDYGKFISNELRNELKTSDKVLLSRDVRLLKDTKEFVQGKEIRVPQLIREGRQLGTGAIVIGRITKLVFRQQGDDVGLLRQKESLAAAEVEVKVFDVSGGREILGITRTGETSEKLYPLFQTSRLESPDFRKELLEVAIRDAVKQLAPEIANRIEKLSWQGRIARIVGSRVYVNAGKEAGVMRGDVLRVVTVGEEVFDPETGAFLGETRGHLKGTLEVKEFLGDDAAIATIHSGGNFREGDIVKLY